MQGRCAFLSLMHLVQTGHTGDAISINSEYDVSEAEDALMTFRKKSRRKKKKQKEEKFSLST